MYQLGQLFVFPAAKNETLILFKGESYITLLLFHSIEKSVFVDMAKNGISFMVDDNQNQ